MRNLVLGLAGSLALAASVQAKGPLPGNPDDLSVQAVHNFAACLADTTPKGAQQLLAMDYREDGYKKALRRFAKGHADGRCMNASVLRSNDVLIAGGVAERLLVETVKPDRFRSLVAYDATKAPIAARSTMEATAICVVRAEPAKAYAIFQTEPTSTDEGHAMQAIAPSLMNCVKAGQKVTLNKPGLRSLLALAAYRLTQPEPVVAADAKPMNSSLVNQ